MRIIKEELHMHFMQLGNFLARKGLKSRSWIVTILQLADQDPLLKPVAQQRSATG